ncbi:MAG: primosomal protein N' [Acidobacteriota bacterium]
MAVTLPVPGRYHYSVPERLLARARIGARVLVPFGARKVTGVVVREGGTAPEGVAPLAVADALDELPSLLPELVELCGWIADYYEAPPGEVIRAALPAGSGVKAHKAVHVTDAGRAALAGEGGALPGKQRELLARIAAGGVRATGLPAAHRRVLDELRARGLVAEIEERDAARVRLPKERVVALADGVDVDAARAQLARSKRKLAVIELLAGAGGPLPARTLPGPAVRELAKAGLVRVIERPRVMDPVRPAWPDAPADLEAAAAGEGMPTAAIPELTAEQHVAVDAITGALGTFTPFLLHGVTGSGKTEVYLRVIAAALARGQNALVLVPEISLTPQLAARFRARFGDEVAILHSGLTEQARLGEWSRLRRGEARIAVGARSAVFAPLEHLGAIVVDEEHDGSFKQEEGVRYHARDVALVRAQRAGCVCVLGSATPSLETYAQTERGAVKKLVLTERPPEVGTDEAAGGRLRPATARPMPSVEVVDLRVHVPDGEAMLASPLRQAIRDTLAAGDQIILFLNRRGFATFVVCRACGHAFRCANCSVSMTYHRFSDRLVCHYCGKAERVPEVCPDCGGKDTIVRKGLGTEKVAAAVAAEFPEARVARLDRDVASGAKVEGVLAKVARREVDILVGTQMVTKGHDFPGVTLVGVLCADTGLDLPDFRASERTFQLLAQVAGRAGRGDRPGRVIVQTYRPGSHAVTCAAAHDYASFFHAESSARAELGYPPHGRLIAVRVDGADGGAVERTAHRLAQLAEAVAKRPENLGVEIRGAVAAPLERLRNRTRWQIWLRGADRAALRRVARGVLTADVDPKIRVVLDVDPISTL